MFLVDNTQFFNKLSYFYLYSLTSFQDNCLEYFTSTRVSNASSPKFCIVTFNVKGSFVSLRITRYFPPSVKSTFTSLSFFLQKRWFFSKSKLKSIG